MTTAVNNQPLPFPWIATNQPPPPSRLTDNEETNLPDYNNIKQLTLQYFKKIPIVTYSLIIICSICYVLDWIVWLSPLVREGLGLELGSLGDTYFGLDPVKILQNYQVWRLLTYPLFHTGLFHLLFNLLATVPGSILMERQLGSIQFGSILISLFMLIPAILFTTLWMILTSLHYYVRSSMGLSGIFFSLLVWQVKEMPQLNPCILCKIPSPAYPSILLLVLTLFLPNLTLFLGHLFGLLVGYAFAYGLLNCWKLRESTIYRIEDLHFILKLRQQNATRFISLNERLFCSNEPTDLPSHNNIGSNDSTNLIPNSRR